MLWAEVVNSGKLPPIHKIKPSHKGINEYLGELYVQTNQIDKANERLAVLKNCNCAEYQELELIIKNKGVKIY